MFGTHPQCVTGVLVHLANSRHGQTQDNHPSVTRDAGRTNYGLDYKVTPQTLLLEVHRHGRCQPLKMSALRMKHLKQQDTSNVRKLALTQTALTITISQIAFEDKRELWQFSQLTYDHPTGFFLIHQFSTTHPYRATQP